PQLRALLVERHSPTDAHHRPWSAGSLPALDLLPDVPVDRAAAVSEDEPEVRLVLTGLQAAGLAQHVAGDHLVTLGELHDERPGKAAAEAAWVQWLSRFLAGGQASLVCHTVLPATIVRTGRPVSLQPAKGVLRLLERKRSGSTTHAREGWKSVMSAGAPRASVPASSEKARAGVQLILSISVGRSIRRFSTSSVIARPSAVSSPTIPKGASSNACSFSS